MLWTPHHPHHHHLHYHHCYYLYSHFTKQVPKTQRGSMTHPRLYSWEREQTDLNSDIQTKAVVHVIRLVSFLWLWFSVSALWWRRIRGLWMLPDGRDWLRGKLSLVLMGRASLSKSLIQFLLKDGAVFPLYHLIWGQIMVEVMKIMVTSFKRSHARTATLSVPSPEQATADPRLCQRLLDTHGLRPCTPYCQIQT